MRLRKVFKKAVLLMKRFRGRGVRRQPGQMNGWEKSYALHLEERKAIGEILWFEFDSIKFRLAEKTFYTPDFLVMNAKEELEIHEVKGHWEDDARVKIKVAADKFPMKFVGVTIDKLKGWVYEEF